MAHTKTYIVAENWGKDLLNIANLLSLQSLDYLVMFGKYQHITRMQIFG
jgi:hypothetical protein